MLCQNDANNLKTEENFFTWTSIFSYLLMQLSQIHQIRIKESLGYALTFTQILSSAGAYPVSSRLVFFPGFYSLKKLSAKVAFLVAK